MGAPKRVKPSFNSRELEVLDWAYRSAFAKLEIRDPDKAEAVNDFLRHKVTQIAQFGVTDPKILRDLALNLMPPLSPEFRRPRQPPR
jgi:hypothetical protein